jgi:DNA polymerase-1
MIEADQFLQKEKVADKAHLILQVHDELVYEMEESLIEDLSPKIKKIMENVLTPDKTSGVPILVEVASGENWGNMEKIV